MRWRYSWIRKRHSTECDTTASSISLLTPHCRLHSQESSLVFFNVAVSALLSTTCYPPHARYEQEYRRAAAYLPNYMHYTRTIYPRCVVISRTGRTT
ncbi:hypothetical protein EVAR_58944_1 [Eumeta japonica]|uniref:Uncharacterized protein n=1 Tax=Eumeta variegata TaxID=151549 RepID=A0A4C1YF45_EUMVA|nr:hypothetical protein EVAR_58944_1 [Eumeta japonica]